MIAKAYKWFWSVWLRRLEPFTYQYRRQLKEFPIAFWVTIIAQLFFVITWIGMACDVF